MVICSCFAQNSAGGHEWNCPNNLSSNPMTPEQIGRMMEMQPTHESEELARLRAENAELKRDAERWRTYLKVFAEEELVEAEWKGPEAITAYIDAAMKGQT